MTNWTYYTVKGVNSLDGRGYLYDEAGEREHFDGMSRTPADWEQFLESQDIRGTVR